MAVLIHPQNSLCDMLDVIYSPSFVVLVCLFSLAAILPQVNKRAHMALIPEQKLFRGL